MARSGEARRIRIAAGLSQAEVAAAVRTSVSGVSLWERGLRIPRGDGALKYGRLIAALAERRAA